MAQTNDGTARQVRIHIVRRRNGGHYAAPSPQFLVKGDQLIFESFTDSPAEVTIPGVADGKPISVPANGASRAVTVTGARGHYLYTIELVDRDRKFYAWGGSEPEIIIDP